MLYLVLPNSTMLWADLPHDVTVASLVEHKIDLSRIEWLASESTADETTIRLALRYGLAEPRGILIEARTISDHRNVGEIIRTGLDAQAARKDVVQQEELMERIMPGWKKRGELLDAAITESIIETAQRQRAHVEEDLKAAPKEVIIDHWTRVGGIVPDPI